MQNAGTELDAEFWLMAKWYLVVCPDASVVHASDSGQLQANPHVAGPWLSPGKPTRRAVATMGSNDLVVGEVHLLGPSFQRITGKRAGVARLPLAAHLGEGKL